MCSVVGYVGHPLGRHFILQGLSHTEYRGYDSAGFACFDIKTNALIAIKSIGFVEALKNKVESTDFDGNTVIGHTRWATHGGLTEENAHPHFDCNQDFFVVHNGIIENYHIIKKDLERRNHHFYSQTDTEVIAHLLEEEFFDNDFSIEPEKKIYTVIQKLQGAFALVILARRYPEKIFFARNKSPLCIGIAHDYRMIASDILAFGKEVNQVLYIPDGCSGFVSPTDIILVDNNAQILSYAFTSLIYDNRSTGLSGYSHYMIKEIYEQKSAVIDTVMYLNNNHDSLHHILGLSIQQINSLEHIKLIGCGTSWHSGRIAQFFFEEIAGIQTAVHLASEFRQMRLFKKSDMVGICISQSGETADTLEALRFLGANTIHTIGLVNVEYSSIVREANGSLVMKAGPEIAVASTKAFAAQVASLYWLAHYCAVIKGISNEKALEKASLELINTVMVLDEVMNRYAHEIKTVWGPFYSQFDRAICLGRHISYPFALEAALKIKEIDYIFAQCYPAGELKHGPLALIDNRTPVIVFSVLDQISYIKLVSNVQEAKTRGAHILAFLFEGQDELRDLADTYFLIPIVPALLAPLAMNGVMLLLVSSIGLHLGLSIDKPRNLAKSVTVE